MTANAQGEKNEPKLSCRESNLILRVIPLRKDAKKMREEEIAAIKHYLRCKSCCDRGLADILDTKLTCKEAILIWADQAIAMWLHAPKTLIEKYAIEHVWGKYQWQNEWGGHGEDVRTACHERPCRKLHSYWKAIPMSTSAGDGPEGVIHLYPFLFDVFLTEKWSLNELLALQKKRIAEVLAAIESRKITVSRVHYNSMDELAAEVREHLAALQKLAVRSQTQVTPP